MVATIVNKKEIAHIGLARPIAIIYLLFGATGTVATLIAAQIGDVDADWYFALVPPGALTLSALGTLRRTWWGRWSAYFLSAIFLIGVPTGTVIGALMLRHLTLYRSAFKRWY